MPQFPRAELEYRINEIETEAENLQRLQTLDLLDGEVLNVGCTRAQEPIALMKVLNTKKVTGINITITQVYDSCSNLQLLLNEGRASSESSYITEDDRLFWQNRIPNFLKEGVLPRLLEENLIDSRQPYSHFNLVYSSGVLKHIKDVRPAIDEMKRVLKLGGWVVTDGFQGGKFKEVFEQVGLRFCKEKSDRLLEFYEKIGL